MLRYFNFEPSFKLRWHRARDLFENLFQKISSPTPLQFETWLKVEVSQNTDLWHKIPFPAFSEGNVSIC